MFWRKTMVGATTLAIAVGGAAFGLRANGSSLENRLGFVPLADAPQTCSAVGVEWSPSATVTKVMQKGDPAETSTVPGENDMIATDPSGRFLFTVSEAGSNGAVTKHDNETGANTILAQRADWNRLDPIKWYAPSGTLLIGEEDGKNGQIFQVDPETGANTLLAWLGNMSHEGIAFGRDGAIWMGDENHTGAIYRAVPTDASDLTKGGTLYAMVEGGDFFEVAPATSVDDAYNGNATLFDRPEDFDQKDGRIYFTVTEPSDDATASSKPGHTVREGGVYSVNDSGTPHVTKFVTLNDPATGELHQQVEGLQFPDNIAFDRKGNLWIHEDIPDDSGNPPTNVHSKQYRDMQDELLVALPDNNGDGMSDGVHKFANMGNSAQATPCQNEWTGGFFFLPRTFYVNQQHAENPTWKVQLPAGKELNK